MMKNIDASKPSSTHLEKKVKLTFTDAPDGVDLPSDTDRYVAAHGKNEFGTFAMSGWFRPSSGQIEVTKNYVSTARTAAPVASRGTSRGRSARVPKKKRPFSPDDEVDNSSSSSSKKSSAGRQRTGRQGSKEADANAPPSKKRKVTKPKPVKKSKKAPKKRPTTTAGRAARARKKKNTVQSSSEESSSAASSSEESSEEEDDDDSDEEDDDDSDEEEEEESPAKRKKRKPRKRKPKTTSKKTKHSSASYSSLPPYEPPVKSSNYRYVGKVNDIFGLNEFHRRKREEETELELGVTHMYCKDKKSVVSVPDVVLKERGYMDAQGWMVQGVKVGGNYSDYLPGEKRVGWM